MWAQVGGGTLQGRGSMETVDGWAWLVPVVCPENHDNHGWHWWQWVLLVLLLAVVRRFNYSKPASCCLCC